MSTKLKEIHFFKNAKNPHLRCYFTTFTATVLIMVITCIVAKIIPFGNNSLCTNDGPAQYIPFLTEFTEKIRSGDSLFYSFNGALGFNFFGTMAYYLMSPFSFIALFFKKENMVLAANIIIILKLATISVTMNYFLLNRYKIKRYIFSILFSLAYVFSYYFIGYMYNFMWLDTIALMPVILLAAENIDTRKNRIIYTITLAAALICNFYMGALMCIFIALYFLLVVSFKNLKDFGKKFASIAIFSIIAVMISAIVLLPVFNTISQMGAKGDIPSFSFFNQLTYVFKKHMPFTDVITLSHNKGDANIFCTMFVIFLAMLGITNKTIPIKRRIGTLILAILFLFSFSNSIGNFIMHGMYSQRGIPNRFAVFYIFILVTCAYEAFIYFKGTTKENLKITFIAIIIILSSVLIDLQFSEFTKNDYIMYGLITLYIICAPILYSLLLFRKNYKADFLIGILLTVEILGGLVNVNTCNISNTYQIETSYMDAVDTIDENGFARSEVLSTDITNAPTLYSLKGASSFNSIINSETASLFGKLGFVNGSNYYKYFGHSPVTDALFGIKYVYSKYNEVLPPIFEEVDLVGPIHIYKNNYTFPIAFPMDFSPLKSNYANKFQNLNNLTEAYGTIYVGIPIETTYETDSTVIKKDNSNFLLTKEKGKDTITFTITNINEKNVFLYTRSAEQGNACIKVNDVIRFSDNNTGIICFLGDLKEEDVVTIKYSLPEKALTNNEMTVFLSRFNMDSFMAFYNDIKSNALFDTNITSTEISGKFIADEDNTPLVFSIPYDSSWTPCIDGEKAELKSELNALCKIEVPKGEHEIIMKYTPKLFFEGTIITGIGLFLLICYIFSTRKKGGPNRFESTSRHN